MDKTIELMREYLRVADMCKGTDVKPWECVRYIGVAEYYDHPTFDGMLDHYTFAIAILEGRPVFVGDRLYGKISPVSVLANEQFNLNDYTWTPPAKKRTFMLNGVELPCPIVNTNGYCMKIGMKHYYFKSVEDALAVNSTLQEILHEARDKE